MQVLASPKHKMLVVPDAVAVRNLLPDARPVKMGGCDTLLVPHGLTETFLLRKLGYQVPSPILTHYKWPSAEPFDVQKKTCALLTMNPRAYVLNGMGTGKTKSALWAWDYLRSNNFCGRMLVVAPLSTLNFVWAREIFATLPHRKCSVLHGTRQRRLDLLRDPETDIFVVNHDGLNIIHKELANHPDIDVLVLDELAVYRNGGSDRSKITRKVAATMKWVWGMTGSPMPNKPTDVWSQATIVTPHSVPKYFNRFRDSLMTQVAQFVYVPKEDAVERAYSVLQPAVRFKLDDILELPECVERTVDVELGPKQARVYKDIATKCVAAVANKQITAINAGAAMNKLLQVSTGWVYTADGKIVELDNGKRIEALVDAVLSAEHKVLVFVPFKHALAGLSKALEKEYISHAVVSGDVGIGARSTIFNEFQNSSKYKVLLAHPQCLAHGLTLTAADTVIWYAPLADLEVYDQANARIRRVGQKHKQLILHFQSTPVEKKIYKLLREKQSVQSKLLELFEIATPTQEH